MKANDSIYSTKLTLRERSSDIIGIIIAVVTAALLIVAVSMATISITYR